MMVEAELSYIDGLDLNFFETISQLAGVDIRSDELRQLTTEGVHTSVGFMVMDSFQRVKEYPFQLTQGKIEQSLKDLSELATDCGYLSGLQATSSTHC